MKAIIANVTLLVLLLTLPLSALAQESAGELQAIIAAAKVEADRELAADGAYRQASAGEKKLLRNAAVRRLVVAKIRQSFDNYQLQVDREIERRIGVAFGKNRDDLVPDDLQMEIRSRFMAELYIYMAENNTSEVMGTYMGAEGNDGDIYNFLERNLKNQSGFDNEIEKILEKIVDDLKAETGIEVNHYWCGSVRTTIINEFNK